jgi:hypothetical protein
MAYNFSDDVLARNPELQVKPSSPSKYKNVRTEANGMMFQSGREAAGVGELILLEEQGLIYGLRLQVKFPLPGKVLYIADAVYLEKEDGKIAVHVIDFKGFKTEEYKIKKKLFRETYGIDIEER